MTDITMLNKQFLQQKKEYEQKKDEYKKARPLKARVETRIKNPLICRKESTVQLQTVLGRMLKEAGKAESVEEFKRKYAKEKTKLESLEYTPHTEYEKLFGADLASSSFQNYKIYAGHEQQLAFDICYKYACNIKDILKSGKSLILSGRPGTGKDHLSCAIAKAVRRYIAKKFKKTNSITIVNFCDVQDRVLSAQVKDPEQKLKIVKEFIKPDFLLLGEIGVGHKNKTCKDTIYRIIDGRYKQKKPFILTTNFKVYQKKGFSDFLEYIDEDGEYRVWDRLTARCEIVTFDWQSFRGMEGEGE